MTRFLLMAAVAFVLAGCDVTNHRDSAARTTAPASRLNDVAFRVLDMTANSSYRATKPTLTIVDNDRRWRVLWVAHTAGVSPPRPLPAVRFETQTVLAYFDGSDVGPISVSRIHSLGRGAVVVNVRKVDTGNCPRPAVLENNAVLVSVDQRIRHVTLRRNVVTDSCR